METVWFKQAKIVSDIDKIVLATVFQHKKKK